jgi:hypothetical protein
MTFPKVGFIAYVCFAIVSVTGAATAEPQAKSLGVKRLVLAHGIDGHEPQEPTTSFTTNNDRVYAFVEVSNTTKSEETIHVVFQPPTGAALAEIPLKVGSATPRFRTWAFTRKVHEAGEWAVIVRDDHGKLLGRQSFTVAK